MSRAYWLAEQTLQVHGLPMTKPEYLAGSARHWLCVCVGSVEFTYLTWTEESARGLVRVLHYATDGEPRWGASGKRIGWPKPTGLSVGLPSVCLQRGRN